MMMMKEVMWENSHLSMAKSLSNKCAKIFCKRTVLVQFVVEDVVTRSRFL